MRITEHFSSEEFNSKDGAIYPPEWIETKLRPLCEANEKIRALVNQPMTIISGYRTPERNAETPGAVEHSRHIEGDGEDVFQVGMTVRQLYDAFENLIEQGEIPDGGLGLYLPNGERNGHVHYDQRGTRARWTG